MFVKKIVIIATLISSISTSGKADFIDAQWTVVEFTGEAWFVDAQSIIGKTQTFNRGYGDGIFYRCNYAGQSSSYTYYDNDEFFINPEFTLFKPIKEEMTLSSETLFVHRITCEGDTDADQRRVIYPFVTNETRQSAWYLFEGGVFSLRQP